jgi:hypothetical protein
VHGKELNLYVSSIWFKLDPVEILQKGRIPLVLPLGFLEEDEFGKATA